jgi:hypothetical protein
MEEILQKMPGKTDEIYAELRFGHKNSGYVNSSELWKTSFGQSVSCFSSERRVKSREKIQKIEEMFYLQYWISVTGLACPQNDWRRGSLRGRGRGRGREPPYTYSSPLIALTEGTLLLQEVI